MNKKELLKLESLSHLTPKELKRKNRELFNQLKKKADAQFKEILSIRLKEKAEELHQHAEKLAIKIEEGKPVNIKKVVSESLKSIGASDEVIKKVVKRVKELELPDKLEDVLQPEVPLKENPLFHLELQQAKLYHLGDAAKLDEAKTEVMIKKYDSLAILNDTTLESLVKEGALKEKEAKELGLTISLYRFFDEDIKLVETVKKGRFPQIPKGKVKEIKDLAAFEKEDWLGVLKKAKVQPPEGLKLEDYADLLSKKVENLYPSESLFARIIPKKFGVISEGIERLQPLFERNVIIFGADDFSNLNIEGIEENQVEALRKEYTKLKRFANTYPGMGIEKILDDKSLSINDKKSRIKERVALLKKVKANNPEVEFLAIDYSIDSKDIKALDFGNLSREEQKMILSTLKAYQRAYSISKDMGHTRQLISTGYTSAASIADETFDTFIKRTELPKAIAKKYYDEALATVGVTTTAIGSILDVLVGGFDWIGVGNLGPSIKDFLKKIDGFDDLFGSQNYCKCKHCQSILGPAAYFVDLMYFVEKNILSKHFTGNKANHVLNLKTRRPDLWKLPLTCENTYKLVPYLNIINEILENYVAVRGGFSGDLSNRSDVEEFVYKQQLQDSVDSFKQPFLLPLEKLRIYLSHFDRTQGEIASLLEAAQSVISAETLKLSKHEYELITQTNTNLTFLNKLYGIQFEVSASTGKVKAFDAQLLLKPMGLKRTELGDLIDTDFVTAYGVDSIKIIGEKTDSSSIQNDIERIHGLKASSLDRMHRFTRLWCKIPWTIPELDLVLSHLDKVRLASGISGDALHHIVEILAIQKRFNISVEESCALWGPLPRKAVSDDKDAFFDRLFNLPDFVLLDGEFPKDTTIFIHPSFRQSGSAAVDNALHRLLAGLQVSDEELYLLITNLSAPLGLNLSSTNESDKGFNLTLHNLSLLYRHARLAEWLKLSIPELFQLINHADTIPSDHIGNLNELSALLKFFDWWKTTDYTLDDLGFITGGQVRNTSTYPDKDDIRDQLLNKVKADNALIFADTLFAFLESVTEEESRAIIAANSAVIESIPDGNGYWLTVNFDPNSPLTIPSGISVTETKVRSLLLSYHATEIIPGYLSGMLGFSAKKTKELIGMVGADLTKSEYTLELQGSSTPDKLTQLIERLLPLSTLFKDDLFDVDSLNFIKNNPGIFGISDFNALDIQSVRRISLYRGFLNKLDKKVISTDLQSVLLAFDPIQKFSSANQDSLAKVLDAELGLILPLQENISLPNTALEALDKLSRCVELAKYLGIGGEALKLIISEDYIELVQASDAVLSAFRAKYDDEEEWKEKIEPFENKILSLKRDALTDYLIHSVHPEFENMNDLYHYFLIDVELEGCARTSKLVAALSSIQLYVQRCLMNLEQDAKDPGTPDRVHVLPEDIPSDEWVWRKNYRLWEANRKVFLYPENYIEPELRDNKTPLFKDLEAELLQKEINKQAALDAYGRYMSGFEEVAHLKIAGSYHEKDEISKRDVLHLFGVTPGDPPTYYYRTIENLYYGEREDNRGIIWTPWQKIDVQIPVRKVAPVVFRGRLCVFWVEITTSPKNRVKDGGSEFIGYHHKMSLKFITLRLDGTWTSPQSISLFGQNPFNLGDGIINDPLYGPEDEVLIDIPHVGSIRVPDSDKIFIPRYDTVKHLEPKDGYTLTGFQWEQVFPEVYGDSNLMITGRNYLMHSNIDFYRKAIGKRLGIALGEALITSLSCNHDKVLCSKKVAGSHTLFYGVPPLYYYDPYAFCSLVLEDERIEKVTERWPSSWRPLLRQGLYLRSIAKLNSKAELSLINRSVKDGIIDIESDLLLIQGSVMDGTKYLLKRLGTTLSKTIARILFTRGVDELLDIETQKNLKESPLPITLLGDYIKDASNAGKLDFKGPYGVYYREIFFHIPFLIANHLNSKQKFEEAQKWYHYIFDPTASELIDVSDPNLSSEEKKRKQEDRNWRYIEFRNLNVQKLRDQLTDPVAIETYKKDPFNPHAIARLRLSAYQKCIVMKYIDNLLDWGDNLFAKDTMESINEATLLYVLAADILGERPAELGECGEGKIQPKTYENIAPLVKKGSEFLIEMEHLIFKKWLTRSIAKTKPVYRYAIEHVLMGSVTSHAYAHINTHKALLAHGHRVLRANVSPDMDTAVTRDSIVSNLDLHKTGTLTVHGVFQGKDWKTDSPFLKEFKRIPSFGLGLIRQLSPVFCVPGNKELERYWDRVEDRLYKIRNCMNIKGVRRQLALFAPEIEPGLLIRAKAAGLSIDDILSSISGNLPPYRFTYLIEKAKNYAIVVQGFGAALLSALEKKDIEELNHLRIVHQQNILKLTTQIRKSEIKAADEAIKSLEKRIKSVEYRKGYYQSLIDKGRTPWEITQSIARHTSSIIRSGEATLGFLAGVFHLIPQVGSPFAMKYGGQETGNSAHRLAVATGTLAAIADSVAASAGLEAGFERREQGWRHQVDLAEHELKQLNKQLEGAKIRKEIAKNSLKIHKKTIEQMDEVYEFYKDKFSDLGLYTWLSTTLQRLYREAYNCAYSMAKLAEQAFRFEREDETDAIIGSGYWESSRAGLLAGERLLVDLENLEQRFVETNYRTPEIDQAFSLTQIDPAALIQLKEKGSCEFNILEIFFDLSYPGHYHRKIKSVRLTIPCITGPYTNISATLTLIGSKLRSEPKLGSTYLLDVPLSRSVSIATSTAQNDAGVFELNFRDERYMPFEGAGAVSSWKLSLPKNFRQFDYQTINDVILHISYTAKEDGLLREKVEELNESVEGTLLNYLKSHSLMRVFSLRQEFSSEFNRLLHTPVGSQIKIKLSDKHFPLFLKGKNIKVNKALLALKTAEGQGVNNFTVSIDGVSYTDFTEDTQMGGLKSKDLGSLFSSAILGEHSFIITNAGELAPDSPAPSDNSAVDSEKLTDIYLYLEYGI